MQTMKKKSASLIRLVKIPKIYDDCFLFFAEHPHHIPFKVKRVYYITKAAKKLPRGYHAHHKTQQVLFCIQGSIEMILNNGKRKEKIILKDPGIGVLIDKKIWHEMHNFSKDTILLVLASTKYDPKDYIRNYEKFLKVVKYEKSKI